MAKRTRNLFSPGAKTPYKLSRSRLENFIRCPRCFYLDRRLGVDQPPGFPFNLNSAVDHLFKKEFDHYRQLQEPHPLMKANGVDAVPFEHSDLEKWRDPFSGIQFHHKQTNITVFGGIDDLWRHRDGSLIVVDYKATSKDGEITLEDEWKDGYKRQLEIYQWLFQQNGFKVSNTGYFVYTNGLRSESAFNDCLKFKTVLLPYEGNSDWVEEALIQAHACLTKEQLPPISQQCEFCQYIAAVKQVEGTFHASFL